MANQNFGHSHHGRSFYILMTTVVVGAILVLLLINDGKQTELLTGSNVGIEGITEDNLLDGAAKGGKGVSFQLSFDKVLGINEETELGSVKISFSDLNTRIKVNEEELELKGLENVVMEIQGFKGRVDLNEVSILLDGEGQKIIVNGMEISTKKGLKIYFSGLIYKNLEISDIKLGLIETKTGSGELKVDEKMVYQLENEKVKGSGFSGDLTVREDQEELLFMEGTIKAVSVAGEVSLNLG